MPNSAARPLHTSRPLGALLLGAGLIWLLAGCGGSEGAPTGTPAGPSGSLNVNISGLPGGTAAAVNLTGPGGYARTLSSSITIPALAEGQYTLTATDAVAGEDRYSPATTTTSVSVGSGFTATATVSYAIASGSVALSLSGLPSGAPAAIRIDGPNGFSRQLTSAGVAGGLAPGAYMLTATPVSAEGHTYAPATVSAVFQVTASVEPVPVSVGYGLATGAITATVAGLPAGQTPSVLVSGPGGFSTTVASGGTLTNLAPGSYALTGAPVAVGPDQYRVPTPVQLSVSASKTPISAQVQYALSSGRLTVAFSGLPQGAAPSAQVAGPGGFSKLVTTSETITGLTPGAYTVTPSEVVISGVTWGVPGGVQPVAVSASPTPATASLNYNITKGSLALVITGLPQTVVGSVVVTGPAGFADTVTTTSTLQGLTPGTYTLTAGRVTSGVHAYAGTPSTSQAVVVASATPVQSTVTYALASGLLNFTVNGLPSSVSANVTMTGPGGYSQPLTATALVSGLVPGSYTITAATAQGNGSYYSASPASQVVNVPASTTAIQATVSYTSASGALQVSVNGLPAGVAGDVRVTGPIGYSTTVTSTQFLNGLLAGTYTATASSVSQGGSTWGASPSSVSVAVGAGGTSSIALNYAQTAGPPPPPPPVNFTIDGMHVQQVVQAYTGTVPLIASKNGLLRIFVKASATNTATPAVRVRFYNGATLNSTVTIPAPGASVPTTVSQASLGASWNTTIPSGLMVPGLRILADVDPTDAITESSEADNSYPTSGAPLTMDVRTMPSFDIRFVPVTQSANGQTGGVTAGNVGSYLSWITKVFPIGAVNVDVRAPYTTNAGVLQSGDGNNAWSQVLSELNALRTADGSTRYYAGIAKVTYSSGIAGLGYVPGRATLSWDYLPSASEVVAHELGHNFGRFHAPCGGAGGPDPSYPYAGGQIGVYGYDVATSSLKAPSTSDLMGYCNNNWISDYTYVAVMNHRIANPYVAAARALANNGPRRGLLVWGRITNGQLTLEPAYEVTAPPSLPQRAGGNRLQAYGPLGESLFDLSFEGERVADATDPTLQHFAFVVPLDLLGGKSLARLRLAAQGKSVERRATNANLDAAMPSAGRSGARGVRVRWADREIAGVMVRDARTGEILSFAKGGDAEIVSSAQDVDLVVSDGVRTALRRVRVGAERR